MKNVSRSPLGQAFADHMGSGYATVFLGAVQDQAATANVPVGSGSGHAAAHEAGHLLLGAQAHAPRGLMKIAWDRNDYQDMVQKRLHFTDGQARQIVGRWGSAG